MINPLPIIELDAATSATLVVAAATLFLCVSIAQKKHRDSASSSSIPKIPGLLLLGWNNIGKTENLVAKMEEWAAKYSRNGILEMNLFGTRYVIVCNDKSASQLEAGRPYDVKRLPQFETIFQSLRSEGLFAAEGDNWKHDRRLVGPALNRKNVRDYMSSVKLVSKRLLEKLDSLKAGPIAINNLILSSTLDIIALVACNADINSLERGRTDMGTDLKTLFHAINLRVLIPLPYWKIPLIGQHLDGGGGAANRLVKMYRELIKANEALSDDKKPKNFLTSVLSLSKKEDSEYSMNEDRLIGNIMTMFAAGSETTAVTLCSALYEIARDESGLQDELAAEAMAMKDFEDAGLDDLMNSLPRLRSLVYEVLRIKGPSPFLGMQNMKEVEVGGTTMPPNTLFFLNWRYISTLDDAEPERLTPLGPDNTPRKQFCPRRWLVTNAGGSIHVQNPSHKQGWRPFGVGMRVCPGRDFAEVEMLIILASIMRKFEISLKKNHAPMILVSRFTECPDIDICLELKDRK